MPNQKTKPKSLSENRILTRHLVPYYVLSPVPTTANPDDAKKPQAAKHPNIENVIRRSANPELAIFKADVKAGKTNHK